MLACAGVSAMKKMRKQFVFFSVLVLLTPLAFPRLAEGDTLSSWPFPDNPRAALGVPDTEGFEDYVITLDATVFAFGGIGLDFDANARLTWAPFFVRSRTGLAVLPNFGALQSFEAGIDYHGWTLFADVSTQIVPLEFASTGLWIHITPRPWVLGEVPILRIEGRLGVGPQWRPTGGFTFDTLGTLDVRAGLEIPVSDTRSFDLVVGTNLDTAARWPGGFDLVDWTFHVVAVTQIPWVDEPDSGMLCSVRASLFLFPAIVAFIDLRLDLRIGMFYAYASAGAGTNSFGLEVGVEMSWVSVP